MADKNDFSEIVAALLMRMDRPDRNQAGFNAFTNDALLPLSGMRPEDFMRRAG